MSNRELRLNSIRLLIAMAIAVPIHVGLFFLIPLVAHLEGSRKPEYGGTVLVQLEEPPQVVVPAPEPPPEPAPVVQPVQKPAPSAQPKPQPSPQPKPQPTPRAQPAARPTTAAKIPVQPTPVLTPAAPALPTGPAFKEAGGKTGVVQPLAVPSPLGATASAQAVPGSEPTLPGAGTPSGSAAVASVQKSGVAVAVPTQTAKTAGAGKAGSTLDLRALDKVPAGGSSPAAPAGKTASGVTAGPADARDFSVDWEDPEAGKGRDLLDAPLPNLPSWVAEDGLALAVKISFAVMPDGVVAQPRVDLSSSHNDVDAAVLDAVRRWRFSPAVTTRTVRGTITYTIRAR